MLAEPLLRARAKNGIITPVFCTTGKELELAERIIGEFQASWENKEKKSELDSRIDAIISESLQGGTNADSVKLVRGFCALLERRCVFKAASGLTAGSGKKGRDPDDNNISSNIDAAARENKRHSSVPYPQGLPLLVVRGNPARIRKAVFEESAKRGFALTENERTEIIRAAAQTLQLQSQTAADDILEAMWSDLDDNLILEQFDAAGVDARTLTGWYNLSLMQTLLFRSTKLDFFVSGGQSWKNVLRHVKRLGLMYYLHHHNGRITCSLEGPPSLFKLTDRYGTSLAKLLPSIVFSRGAWQIDAEILRKTMDGEKRIYSFKMTENDVPPLLADPIRHHHGARENEEGAKDSSFPPAPDNYFDSVVEEKFARKFLDLGAGLGWKLVREPDPLIVSGGRAFIPDFLFVKPGRKKVYMEIVGFWTPDYLQRKFQKLAEIYGSAYATKLEDHAREENGITAGDKKRKGGEGEMELLMALNEDLVCSEGAPASAFSRLQRIIPSGRMILYKKDNVPAAPVLDCLKTIDREAVERAVNDPNIRIEIDRTKDIIAIRDIIAKEIDDADNGDENSGSDENASLPTEAILRIVHRDNAGRYFDVAGTHLISLSKAARLKSMLAGVSRFADACAILSREGVPESCQAELVSKLGYDVQWQSLDPSSAIMRKRERSESGAAYHLFITATKTF
jgi:uncharacterized protein